MTFHCVAEGNPGPQYLWTRGRQDSLVQVSTTFFMIIVVIVIVTKQDSLLKVNIIITSILVRIIIINFIKISSGWRS